MIPNERPKKEFVFACILDAYSQGTCGPVNAVDLLETKRSACHLRPRPTSQEEPLGLCFQAAQRSTHSSVIQTSVVWRGVKPRLDAPSWIPGAFVRSLSVISQAYLRRARAACEWISACSSGSVDLRAGFRLPFTSALETAHNYIVTQRLSSLRSFVRDKLQKGLAVSRTQQIPHFQQSIQYNFSKFSCRVQAIYAWIINCWALSNNSIIQLNFPLKWELRRKFGPGRSSFHWE